MSSPAPPHWKLIVVAPTFYGNINDTRYLLGLEACRKAAEHEISLLLVDASPLPDVAQGLRQAGQTTDGRHFVQVIPQTWKGKKGVALKEGIQWAVDDLLKKHQTGDGNSNKDPPTETVVVSVIAFQELEKVDMFRHYPNLLQHMQTSGSHIVVPRRSDGVFKDTYPIEQYHSEQFANKLLDSLGRDIGMPSIDWTIGPVMFRSEQAHHWLDYDGKMWDAQLVPMVEAHLHGAKVSSMECDYRHPVEMKDQEQGQVEWNEKRLYQINVLLDTVGKRMKDAKVEGKN